MNRYRYYCIMRPPMIGGVPHSRTLQDAMCYDERRYIPEIDRAAWGWVEYAEPLTPQEVEDYELIRSMNHDDKRKAQ